MQEYIIKVISIHDDKCVLKIYEAHLQNKEIDKNSSNLLSDVRLDDMFLGHIENGQINLLRKL